MNAIARALTSGIGVGFARPTSLSYSKSSFKIFLLFMIIVVSALSVLYIKDLNRRLFIEYQNMQLADTDLQVEYGKLLLEQSTWASQARVQAIAENNLEMEIPATANVVMLQSNS